MDLPESDWKTLRKLQPVALDRFCRRVLDECRTVCDNDSKTSHERYLDLYKLLRTRDKELADAFDDMRRSVALLRLVTMYRRDLLTEDEVARFSPETRELVTQFPG